jgi:hypothetical protein
MLEVSQYLSSNYTTSNKTKLKAIKTAWYWHKKDMKNSGTE